MTVKLGEIARLIGAKIQGDPDCHIEKLATLQNAEPGDISFLANARYRRYLKTTKASAVIVAPKFSRESPCHVLVVKDPYLAYAKAAVLLSQEEQPYQSGIHPSAVVDANSHIDATAWIGPLCVIEAGVVIGPGTCVGPGCVIKKNVRIGADCLLVARITCCQAIEIGNRVIIHPGAVIGADGFGLANDGGKWMKVPQLGGVRIHDDVEIGANTTIDRGAVDDTVIETGVKIDNLVQIAHNVMIGADTAIAGCVGIAGSAVIGKRCSVGGGVGILGHVNIADDVSITGMSFVMQSIADPGIYSAGTPLETNRVWRRNMVRLRRLDEIFKRVYELEKKLK